MAGDRRQCLHLVSNPALLRKDIERILNEAGFCAPQFVFTNVGGIPKFPQLHWQTVSAMFRGLRYSDNLVAIAHTLKQKSYPSPVTQFLEKHGYTVFRIWKGFWKPLLEHPENNPLHPWEPPSYLGTKDTLRAIERLKKPGWFSLYTARLSI